VFLLIIKAFEPRPFDILDDQSSSVGLRSTLNYKRTMVAIPFELSVGTEIAFDTYQFSLFRNLYLSQPKAVFKELNLVQKTKSNYRTILCKWIFPFRQNGIWKQA
jgi:iron complex outermembrane receptor protein